MRLEKFTQEQFNANPLVWQESEFFKELCTKINAIRTVSVQSNLDLKEEILADVESFENSLRFMIKNQQSIKALKGLGLGRTGNAQNVIYSKTGKKLKRMEKDYKRMCRDLALNVYSYPARQFFNHFDKLAENAPDDVKLKYYQAMSEFRRSMVSDTFAKMAQVFNECYNKIDRVTDLHYDFIEDAYDTLDELKSEKNVHEEVELDLNNSINKAKEQENLLKQKELEIIRANDTKKTFYHDLNSESEVEYRQVRNELERAEENVEETLSHTIDVEEPYLEPVKVDLDTLLGTMCDVIKEVGGVNNEDLCQTLLSAKHLVGNSYEYFTFILKEIIRQAKN